MRWLLMLASLAGCQLVFEATSRPDAPPDQANLVDVPIDAAPLCTPGVAGGPRAIGPGRSLTVDSARSRAVRINPQTLVIEASDSTIEINSSYMQILPDGNHTRVALFLDGNQLFVTGFDGADIQIERHSRNPSNGTWSVVASLEFRPETGTTPLLLSSAQFTAGPPSDTIPRRLILGSDNGFDEFVEESSDVWRRRENYVDGAFGFPNNQQASMTRDGRRIAFLMEIPPDNKLAIHVADRDDVEARFSNPIHIATIDNAQHPAIAVDCSALYFTGLVGGVFTAFVADLQ